MIAAVSNAGVCNLKNEPPCGGLRKGAGAAPERTTPYSTLSDKPDLFAVDCSLNFLGRLIGLGELLGIALAFQLGEEFLDLGEL